MTPTILAQKPHTLIIALSETEVGKVNLFKIPKSEDSDKNVMLFKVNELPTLQREIEATQFANSINDLLPQFIRKDIWKAEDGKEHDMMVMERLYPLHTHHFDLETRNKMFDVFEEKMSKLHMGGFVHGDFCRPAILHKRRDYEWLFENIVQTTQGLRLLDPGFALYIGRDDVESFVDCLLEERKSIKLFRKYYFEEIKSVFRG
jgi:hypothetical protein